jgi:hypothetical protein
MIESLVRAVTLAAALAFAVLVVAGLAVAIPIGAVALIDFTTRVVGPLPGIVLAIAAMVGAVGFCLSLVASLVTSLNRSNGS